MNLHIVVSVYQGVPEGCQAYLDKEMADQGEQKAKAELGIVEGAEEESENAVELFYNVPVIERG